MKVKDYSEVTGKIITIIPTIVGLIKIDEEDIIKTKTLIIIDGVDDATQSMYDLIEIKSHFDTEVVLTLDFGNPSISGVRVMEEFEFQKVKEIHDCLEEMLEEGMIQSFSSISHGRIISIT